MNISELLIPTEENDCVQDLEEHFLVDSFFAAGEGGTLEGKHSDGEEDGNVLPPSPREQFRLLALENLIFLSAGHTNEGLLKGFMKWQAAVRKYISQSRKQTKIY